MNPCVTCSLPAAQRREIDVAFLEGRSLNDVMRSVPAAAGISRASLMRHRRDHIGRVLAQATGKAPPTNQFGSIVVNDPQAIADVLPDMLTAPDMRQRLKRIADDFSEMRALAKESGAVIPAVAAGKAEIDAITAAARLENLISDAPVVNVTNNTLVMSSDDLAKRLMARLTDPAARAAVAAALAEEADAA